MTEAYDWTPMPHRVNIKCPNCGSLAEFEFAEIVRITLKADVEYFQESDVFEYGFFEDRNGSRWHGAVFYHGLRGSTSDAIKDLPAGYSPTDWDHSPYFRRSHGLDIGSAVCASCGYRKKHTLKWPDEAYFQIAYKGEVLWGFNRESTTELLEYVCSQHRSRQNAKWRTFLRHVPSHFLSKHAREHVSKKLRNLL